MKKLIYSSLLLVSISIFSSCSKEESNNALNTANNGVFVFTSDNGVTNITADSAYFDTRYNTIKAFKGGAAMLVEINLAADTVGVYNIGGLNAVSYLNGTSLYVANLGAVTISSISSSKTTGVFSSTSVSPAATLTGTFTNIEVR